MGPASEAGPRFLTAGHDAAVAAIARFITAARPPHGLLISGPRGVGKTTLALDLAAGLLCLADDPSARPCRACRACRTVVAGDHPDVHRLAPEGAGDQIRIGRIAELAMDLSLLAMEGRFRIAIMSAAQRMNPDAQNALLKTLEEPGPGTCLVLCADETGPLLPTVLSRVAQLRLAPMPPERLTDLLVARGMAPPMQARALAVAAGGRPGLAFGLAGQPDAAVARDRIVRTLIDLVRADRRTRLGASAELLADGAVLDAAVVGGVAPSAATLQAAERRRAALAVLATWRVVARDLAVVVLGGSREVRDLGLLADLTAVAPDCDAGSMRRFLDRLDALSAAVEAYASPTLVLDVLLLDWPGRPVQRPAA